MYMVDTLWVVIREHHAAAKQLQNSPTCRDVVKKQMC